MAGELEAVAYATRLQQDIMLTTRVRIRAAALTAWDAMPSLRDEAVEQLVAAVVPRVQAGQVQLAEVTNAYLSQQARLLGYEVADSVVDARLVTGARGVAAAEVYERPAATVRAALAEGEPWEAARLAGRQRLASLVVSDLQLAARTQARETLRGSGVSLYRRALTGRENCALCMLAATNVYGSADLMPIHPGCDCTVEPLPRGQTHVQLDQEMVRQIHSAVYEHTGAVDYGGREIDYRQIQLTTDSRGNISAAGEPVVRVRQHGEYGPTLTWADHEFTGPQAIAA
ncbi:hypothetical protein [Actinobaculum sp. 352]|uniref:hypothetical protein n=1 Tax=Actinobaculum sp. 352 TaxID=2490946 RepID=UPI000F7F0ED5|nr:hypothetical protein [Actinobaculum sp. 352]RTE50397.1 hypothetical protein EKN07_04155 [Actinobaculum sp. 352]